MPPAGNELGELRRPMITTNNGFTLIEAVPALPILSAGLLALGAATGHATAQIRAGELRSDPRKGKPVTPVADRYAIAIAGPVL